MSGARRQIRRCHCVARRGGQAAPGERARDDNVAARGERGSALLVVVLMAAATIAIAASLIDRAALVATELRARRAVLCARYTALGGLALATPMSGEAAAAVVSPDATDLTVARVRLGASWCVLRATATCDDATRTLDRTLTDPSACSSP